MPEDLPINRSINQSQCHKSSQALVELGEEYRRTDSNHSYHAGCIRLNHDKNKDKSRRGMYTVCSCIKREESESIEPKESIVNVNALHLNSSGWSWRPAIHWL